MYVFVKFKGRTTPERRDRMVRLMGEHGATAVERLYPKATDDARASQFVASAAGEAEARTLTGWLEAQAEVEYAEAQVKRKPR